MRALDLPPSPSVAGSVRLPGSKSISNRVLLLAALAQGVTTVRGLLDAEDTRVMLEALQRLGLRVTPVDAALRIEGAAGLVPARQANLFLGNAGTAFRPLTAALALAGGEYRLSGVARMHERPIGDLVDALRAMGAQIDYLGATGFPPLQLRGGEIRLGGPVRVRGDVSSQFLSALLIALPLLRRAARIEVLGELISRPYVEITLNLMRRFGVQVRREDWRAFDLPGSAYVSPGEVFVEGDASSASYFLAAGALGGGPVRVHGVGRGSIQGDVRFVEVLERMGAGVTLGEDWIECRAGARPLRAFDLDLNHIPDAAMTAAVLALFADGPCTIRNIASWRVKETDRIAAMATELRKLGADALEGSDSLCISPPQRPRSGVRIATYDDHRMAMCFALLAAGGVAVTILDPDCVAKTFPEFFSVFAEISRGAARSG